MYFHSRERERGTEGEMKGGRDGGETGREIREVVSCRSRKVRGVIQWV